MTGSSDNSRRRSVTLAKQGQTWRFDCDAGSEAQLLKRMQQLANREDCVFDWFDAAVVAHALDKSLRSELEQLASEQGTTLPTPIIKTQALSPSESKP
ncbi:MAG: hypothetical protein ACYTF7_07270 [Planctomycetota bacterium]|jgi:hypothetical protein